MSNICYVVSKRRRLKSQTTCWATFIISAYLHNIIYKVKNSSSQQNDFGVSKFQNGGKLYFLKILTIMSLLTILAEEVGLYSCITFIWKHFVNNAKNNIYLWFDLTNATFSSLKRKIYRSTWRLPPGLF